MTTGGGAARRKRHPIAVAVAVADGLVPRVLLGYSLEVRSFFRSVVVCTTKGLSTHRTGAHAVVMPDESRPANECGDRPVGIPATDRMVVTRPTGIRTVFRYSAPRSTEPPRVAVTIHDTRARRAAVATGEALIGGERESRRWW